MAAPNVKEMRHAKGVSRGGLFEFFMGFFLVMSLNMK
jgi:hypothetical protein